MFLRTLFFYSAKSAECLVAEAQSIFSAAHREIKSEFVPLFIAKIAIMHIVP